MNAPSGNAPVIVNPERLTAKALKIAQGKHVINIQPEDWESYLEWLERCEIVDEITTNLFKQYGI